MPEPPFSHDPDVHRAETPPGSFYSDPAAYAAQAALFARSWQLVTPPLPQREHATPWTLLPACLDEPLLLTRDAGGVARCLSNVCTHRGAQVLHEACAAKALRCGYHGRRFGLDGCLKGAPGFEGALDFPRPSDDLPALPLEAWGPLSFTSVDPAQPFATFREPLDHWLGGLPWERAQRAPEADRDYPVAAHWALYVENYLEGLHIPYVHQGLVQALDFGSYRYASTPSGTIQIGVAPEGDPTLALPAGHPAGERVAAIYVWCFPNLMLNVYPWGLSLNLVEPSGPSSSRIRYQRWVWAPELQDQGAGGDLERVEYEDQAVVEAVQRGIGSRLYRRGRYAPAHEAGTHHFHRLVLAALGANDKQA
ncbi:MAG: Rieske 2Fe-2S domain-containing protein [Planctomycetes bacterium]|nr:Rieske 2Fe-2S domain-containing protein [Planctomycetota bacterium]